MTEYRIKKDGREFNATRVETLKELLLRGLLLPTDPVSVDGGDDIPLSELEDLGALSPEDSSRAAEGGAVTPSQGADAAEFSIPRGIEGPGEDPWRHWSNFEADDRKAESDTSEDDVLASFLGQVELTESGTFPALLRSHPKVPAVPRGTSQKAEPRPAAPVSAEPPPAEPSPDRIDPVEVNEADLESIPPALPPEGVEKAAMAPLDASVSAATPPPFSGVAPSPANGSSAEPDLTEEMLGNPDLPVSFRDWLEKNESGGSTGDRLQRFGRYDDGIVRPGELKRRRFNGFRVLLIVLFGGAVILSYYLYVRTAATSDFPMESELAGRVPGAVGIRKPSAQLASVDTPVGSVALQLPSETLARRAREKAVRQEVRRSIVDFTTVEGLQNALFQELANAGVKPVAVVVEPLGHKGTADKYNRRPTKANLTISLSKISAEGDRGYEVLEERLIYAWLLVGKYATLARVQFEDVKLTVAPPLVWSRRYEGRRLALLWEQQIEAADLFPEE